MSKNSFTCTTCPRGCRLTVEVGEKIKVTGNLCPKGEVYGKQEVICPMRMLTTTVATEDKDRPRLSVKTKDTVPLKNFPKYMHAIRAIKVTTPCKPGDVIVGNFCDTGVALVATGEN